MTGFEPLGDRQIRLAMLGMVDGNGHPYSWSAIFNGFDSARMADCPYPVIFEYLSAQPPGALGIEGARVTHVWTDEPADARDVATCSLVPNVVDDPTEVIGAVDAVIIATDKGDEHVERCRPFVEAGLPVFVDKPLVDNAGDLAVFNAWIADGRPIMSSSCMRYAREFAPYRESTAVLGDLRFVSITTPKTWERYGIHALEGAYPILGPGFISARNTGDADRNIVHFRHARGADLVVAAVADMYGAFGVLDLCGTQGHAQVSFGDTFHAFRAQLVDFVRFLRTGRRSFPYAETGELMRMVIAGIVSRERDGAEVLLADIAR
jgi:predicted dehydrogenase